MPYRSWCSGCVSGCCPDSRHEKNKDAPHNPDFVVPTVEFDYATLSGKSSEPDSKVPIISASESEHGSVFASFIRCKGSKDKYVMSSLQNWFKDLGHPKLELKCDQEPSTIEVRNELINNCKSTQLVPFATPKGSKGSLGAGERAHLSIGGKVRANKHSLENRINKARSDAGNRGQDSKFTLVPEHVLIPWLIRHTAWCINRFQVRANGKTPYFSQRGKEYNGETIQFGKVALFKVITEDKFQDRWEKGVSLGKSLQTDEHIYLTDSGMKYSRAVKQVPPSEQYDELLLSRVKGLPWDPTGVRGFDVGNHRPLRLGKDFTVAGNNVRRFYITQAMINELGQRTDVQNVVIGELLTALNVSNVLRIL